MPKRRPESGDVVAVDLESTAELPVLDVAAIDALEVEDESHLRTTVLPPDAFSTSDTHPGIPILTESAGMASADVRVVVREVAAAAAAKAAARAAADGATRAAAEAEAAIGQLLERQAELLREMQEVREEAEARYLRLESDLDAARRLGEDLDAMRREAETRAATAHQQHEAELASLHAQHRAQGETEVAALRAQGEAALAALRLQLDADHAATRHQLDAELGTLREQLAAQAAAHQHALQAAQQEAAELSAQLLDLDGMMADDETALARARQEITALERALDAARAEFAASERLAQQSLVDRSRELDRVNAELAELRGLAAAQVEALQASESRRGIWASLLGDAESAHDAQLREARESAAAERAQAAAVQAELDARMRRRDETEATLRTGLEAAEARGHDAERRAEELRTALAQAQGALVAARADADGQAARLAGLEARLEALGSQGQASHAELETLRAELEALRAERDGLLARNATLVATAEQAAERARVLEAQVPQEDAAESLRNLQGELRRGTERIGELESDLRAAEDQIHRLEGDLRAKSSRLEELGRAGWQPTVVAPAVPSIGSRRRDDFAARGRGMPDVGASGESVMASDSAFSGAGATASADGVTRYFVLMDGDTEIVHVLGRRTTLGRGLDNDVRIDTKFISRHHAVVLAGPNQTVVEDLRSTNGVLVNGRRVTRSALRDGDIVHVGKTQFRFVQRSRDR